MQLYEKTLNLLVERKLSVNKFEKESGIGRGTFSKWEKSVPSIEKVFMAAVYLKVSIDYLCGLTENKMPVAEYDGLTEEDFELIRLFASASPSRQEAAIALLKAP